MEKLDLKKKWKHLYQPSAKAISTVDAPPLGYLMVDGEGDPNACETFSQAVEALYSMAYTLKFSLKKKPGAQDWGVMPLEGLWWADQIESFHLSPKSDWKWTAMILQPEFISPADVEAARKEIRKKKNPAALDLVRMETLLEGPSAQILYLGPFAGEAPVIAAMHAYIHEAGKQLAGRHHEIYLSDPRRTAPEKLKTILRQPMR